MTKNIIELRKEAGYRSGREFARMLGIPASTYARYEQQPDSIPLKQAWIIADFLRCTIDDVVGRKSLSTDELKGPVQRFYDGLQPENRRLFNEFMKFVTQRENDSIRQLQEEDDAKFLKYSSYYERLFLDQMEGSSSFGDMVVFGSEIEIRDAFKQFLTNRAKAKRESEIFEEAACFEFDVRSELGLAYVINGDEGRTNRSEDPEVEKSIESRVSEFKEEQTEKRAQKDKEVIKKILAAYDRAHGLSSPEVVPAISLEYRGSE